MDKIERQWDYFGEENPYFAVSTFNKFHSENLTEGALKEFFDSGNEYVERIWGEIENIFSKDFTPRRSLDFGCGVGRLAIPIAKRSVSAVGVDISQKMLDEAAKNAQITDTKNIEWIKGDNELSKVTGKFDFVHSFIVIQHINPKIGESIFERLIDLLEEGGIGALHLTYNHPGKKTSVLRFKLYRKFPFIYSLRNILLKQRKEPLIPVFTYNLNSIFNILQNNNCHNCTIRFSEHGHEGIIIFFQKKAGKIY